MAQSMLMVVMLPVTVSPVSIKVATSWSIITTTRRDRIIIPEMLQRIPEVRSTSLTAYPREFTSVRPDSQERGLAGRGTTRHLLTSLLHVRLLLVLEC